MCVRGTEITPDSVHVEQQRICERVFAYIASHPTDVHKVSYLPTDVLGNGYLHSRNESGNVASQKTDKFNEDKVYTFPVKLERILQNALCRIECWVKRGRTRTDAERYASIPI